MEFVIVNAGRNVGSRPLGDDDWKAFRLDVHITLTSVGRLVGWGSGLSAWGDQEEEFATFQAEVHETNVHVLKGLLANLARDWGQEAIGFALSGLVEASPSPGEYGYEGHAFEVVGELVVDEDGRLARIIDDGV